MKRSFRKSGEHRFFFGVTPMSRYSLSAGRSCWLDTKLHRKRSGPCLRLCSFRTRSSRVLQLTFGFWELAKHHDFQEKLRVEINETLAKVKARGDVDFTANDFETMPHLMAFTKVRRNHFLVPLNEGEID